MWEPVDNVYNLSAFGLSDDNLQNETFYWKPYFGDNSMSQPNSLWFSSAYYKLAARVSSRSPDDCLNNCTGPLGIRWSNAKLDINNTQLQDSTWTFPWMRAGQSFSTLQPRTGWERIMDDASRSDLISSQNKWPNNCTGIPRPMYLNNDANYIRVLYCLAQPFEEGCKVVLSTIFLLMMTLYIFIKLVLYMGVAFALRDDPLVTPGDAVASFISIPDRTTIGTCAATISDIHLRISDQKPLQGRKRPEWLAQTVSPATWAIDYSFFCILLIILVFLMKVAFSEYPLSAV